MLLIPVSGKISWRNPPIVTIALILINVLVFMALQSDDNNRVMAAERFYFESGLAEIEIPQYLVYSEGLDETRVEAILNDLSDEELFAIHRKIEGDSRFFEKFRRGEIVARDSYRFDEWASLRDEYEHKMSKAVFMRHGFRPAEARPATFLTYMFLHGGFDHLIGNMIFLWILGCVLETGCGRKIFSGIYLIGGILAVLLYWRVYINSPMPLVGASGAIAALMGAYTILFGKKKVNIFYSLGFYFNYIRMPAILLFPLWVGNELYQLFFGGMSQVAYVAHLGGLAGGFALGLAALKSTTRTRDALFEKTPEDEIARLMDRALEHIGQLDLTEGRRLLHRVLEKDPKNITAWTHLYNVEKQDPQNARFHQTAGKLLALQMQDTDHWDRVYAAYIEYLSLAGVPRLNFSLLLRLSTVCAATGHTDKAGQLLFAIIKKKADLPGISTALLKLAQAYKTKGKTQDYRKCLRLIDKFYPDSPEAQMVKKS
jgi:membrane associated rhomboid family serine protease